MIKRRTAVIAGVLGLLLGAALCVGGYFIYRASSVPGGGQDVPAVSVGVTDAQLSALAFETAGYLKSRDYQGLSQLVHPVYGLIFSPSATVNLATNRSFSTVEVKDFGKNSQTYVWGVHSDGNEPISMTVSDYFTRYVIERDYTAAPLMGINYTVRIGNSRETVTDNFPGANYVDLCFPGTKENDYADWSILRLVFEDYQGQLKLTAVIHSENAI